MESHANSTENSEDLKRQIAELKNVSELHYTSMNCYVIYRNNLLVGQMKFRSK